MNKIIVRSKISPKNSGAYLICMFTALVVMLICTRSSPLYAFNNWDDSNSYFTVGKSIFKGLVPYRDLFDQKGMMLYALYGIASLISYKTFLGVFIIETIAAMLACTAMFKIYSLYMRQEISLVLMSITAAFIYSTRSFWWGGSAEEMMMPMFMWGLYLSMRYFKEEYPNPISAKTLVIGGVLAGCVLNIKFNSLGFFFAWMVMILVADLMVKDLQVSHKFKKCVIHGCIFLLGMLIATIPWIVYFALNGALYDWFHVYIYLNVFVYSEKLPMLQRIYNMCKIIYNHMLSNPYCGIMAFLGGASFIVMKSRWIEKLNVIMLAGFTALLIFIGGVELQYYSLPLWTFAVLGGIAIGRVAEYLINYSIYNKSSRSNINVVDDNEVSFDKSDENSFNDNGTLVKRKGYALRIVKGICAVMLACIISYTTSMNTFFMKYQRDDIWIYHFTDIIENSGIDNPTLINMGCFDAGLYTTCGIVPTCRFFQTQTIKISDVGEVQNDFIINGKTDFVLARDYIPDYIDNHYSLLEQEYWQQSGYDCVFYLYQKDK
ncbi:MAG: hypothetical protein K5754_10015 [Butyrivibrio sp.]|nr:hypothetical protein [Butyrivibrio sp.]